MRDYICDLVSTIIPVYNRPAMLQEAVASVLAQTYRPIEIIIVDDGSTDGSPRVCDQLAHESPLEISVIHQQNTGPGLAREAARLIANGEFIQYLDSDDLLLPRKLEWQVAALRTRPECGVCYGKTRFLSKGTLGDAAWKGTGQQVANMFPSFLRSRWWGTSTPLYRSTVSSLAGPWTALRSEEDWEYDCRIAALGVLLEYVPQFVSEERDHNGERLSMGGSKDPRKLRDRAAAHALILKHARDAGIDYTYQEMQGFSRELFHLSRQCGAAGLPQESRELFALAKSASGEARARGWDFKLYEFLAGLLDWSTLGKMTSLADRFRI